MGFHFSRTNVVFYYLKGAILILVDLKTDVELRSKRKKEREKGKVLSAHNKTNRMNLFTLLSSISSTHLIV